MRLTNHIGFVLILTLASSTTMAQHQLFRSYTVTDGLSNNAIREVYQDARGFLWIGTWEGLNKFDGHKFTTYTAMNGLPHSMVNDIYEEEDGKLIIIMNDGSLSELKNGSIAGGTINTKYVVNQVFADPVHGLLTTTDRYGLAKLRAHRLEPVLHGDTSSLYEIIKVGNEYLAIGDKAPLTLYDKDLKLISKADPSVNIYPQTLCLDSKGRIWAGTQTGLKTVMITTDKRPVFAPPPAGFDHPSLRRVAISAILEDHNGHLWIGTHKGLLRFSPDGTARMFTENDGLPGRRITSLFTDREKNLWVGTYSGLAKMQYQYVNVMESLNDHEYLNHSLVPVSADQILLLTSQGVQLYNTRSQSSSSIMSAPYPLYIRGSEKPSILYKNRVFSFDHSSGKMVAGQILTLPGYYFSAAQKGDMIAGAGNGIVLQKGNEKPVRVFDSLRMNDVIWDREGRLWAGGWDKGLFQINVDPVSKEITGIRDMTRLIGAKHIRALHQDQFGNIWVGTRYDGIFVLTQKDKGDWQVSAINQRHGLLSDWVYCFGEAEKGEIWAGTLSGIAKIIFENGSFRVFNFSRATNFYATITNILYAGNRELWAASEKGLVYIKDYELENQPPLPVYITSIRLGKDTEDHALQPPPDQIIRLKHSQNYAKFEFTASGYMNEKEILYSYRLKGSNDTAWSQPASLHTVEYASLQPGNYSFEVRMLGWNGQFGAVNSFPFIVSSPFWLSWWFYLVLAGFLFLVIYVLYRFRIRQLLKLQQVRNHIATDLHDDIGSTLTNISMLSQLSINHLGKPKEVKDFLTRIRDEVQNSSQALDDIIWSVNSRNDSLEEIFARMRRFAGELFDSTDTVCHVEISDHPGISKLKMEQRRDLYLIYKEALTNISKHAMASHVWVVVTPESGHLKLKIQDDGKGFDPSAPSVRNGLNNLRYRVVKWKGNISIKSDFDKGTMIDILFPLSERKLPKKV